ncbi:lipase family protein [Edaphocola aurantiacus]|uniref:lipase family protein n=1 Tax=Edaphocola aurantiacus TaxID=2601682 RepID=UPI001C975848|nr:hypothetical protein [Edaphocola aurantiacus]
MTLLFGPVYAVPGNPNTQLTAPEFNLRPGFDPLECEDILHLNFAFLDTVLSHKFEGFLEGYHIYYRSPSVGLDNAADMWLRDDSTVVIMLRGTTAKMESILEDFYCAMVPAQGSVSLSKHKSFAYQLASDPRAAVHAGFLIGFVYLADQIQPKIHDLYTKGYRKFIVGGHSQGGALCYYVSAWLMQERNKGILRDIIVKTYASAPPKMGNMYFAYDYDNANLSQWSFSIVNTEDPVPEMPLTTQQVDIDINEPNPLLNLMQRIDEMSLLKRFYINRKVNFKKMKKQARKSSEAYQKYLGRSLGSIIQKTLPEMVLPASVPTTYFVRPGVPITLAATDEYRAYCKNAPKYFHHGIDPYRFLLRQYYKGLPAFVPITKE